MTRCQTMKRKTMSSALLAMLILTLPVWSAAHPHILKATNRSEVSPQELMQDLQLVQIVFIGETHNHPGHHAAQLQIIKSLAETGKPLAIGLEMFRCSSQEALDRWVNDEISPHEFMPIYHDNWSMWPLYDDIFMFAREEDTRMVGLNISREITRKVARKGFASLSESERQELGDVQCVVTPGYGKYIRQAMGGHGGHGAQYRFFCEAQILWDTMMAKAILEFLSANPDYQMVVLAGSGHAWKFGIPRQLLDQAEISYRVILPEEFGRIDRTGVTEKTTDYLWLDSGDEGWVF